MLISVLCEEAITKKNYCKGCSKLYLLEKGYSFSGGCDCPSEDRCSCSPMRKWEDVKNDVWQCSLYKKDLGKTDEPKRTDHCVDVSDGDVSKSLNIKKENDKLKKQIKKLKESINITASKHAVLLNFKNSVDTSLEELDADWNRRVLIKSI